MCLIGVIHNNQRGFILFKNRDAEKNLLVPKPKYLSIPSRCKILIFPSTDKVENEIWGGINEHGLCLQFADLLTTSNTNLTNLEEFRIQFRKLHYNILSTCKSLEQALLKIFSFYKSGDNRNLEHICLIVDRNSAVMIECSISGVGCEWLGDSKYLLRSNWPITLNHLSPPIENNYLYMSAISRYNRAKELLSSKKEKNVDFFKQLLTDKKFGDSDFSILRTGKFFGYRTVSSLILEVNSTSIKSHYVINKQPTMEGFFSSSINFNNKH